MATVFVTGSSDGIRLQTARSLIGAGHRVVLHARTEHRAAQASAAAGGAFAVVVGDLSSITETTALAKAANAYGPYDVTIHNAGVGGGSGERLQRLQAARRDARLRRGPPLPALK